MDPFLGSIIIFGGNFEITGWMFCNGQILSIASYQALFALLGTTYGGNGQTTFALPDLRGRTPIGMGQGPGLSNIVIGQVSGVENITLTQNQMPAHTHQLTGSSLAGNTSLPSGALPANTGTLDKEYTNLTTTNVAMHPNAIASAGGSLPISIRNPYIGMNYLIAFQGIFPSRN